MTQMKRNTICIVGGGAYLASTTSIESSCSVLVSVAKNSIKHGKIAATGL
jgi:hypothetical protein